MKRLSIACSLWLLTACGPSESNWPKKSAKASCDWQKRCAPSNFWATYSSTGACEDANEAALLLEATEKIGCLYSEDAAKSCLQALGSSCKKSGQEAETLFAPCLAVYSCPVDPTPDGGSG